MAWTPTVGDLIRALGGAKVLRQLTDPNQTGEIDNGIAQSFIDSAVGRVKQRALVKHDPETLDALDAESAQTLLDMAVGQAVRFAYERGGQGQTMTPQVEAMAVRSDNDLVDLAEGRIRLSRASGRPQPALNQPVGVVDFDPTGTGISMAGFKRGFR